jgi:hypothetical protein
MQENVLTTKTPYEEFHNHQVVQVNEALHNIGVDKALQDL